MTRKKKLIGSCQTDTSVWMYRVNGAKRECNQLQRTMSHGVGNTNTTRSTNNRLTNSKSEEQNTNKSTDDRYIDDK